MNDGHWQEGSRQGGRWQEGVRREDPESGFSRHVRQGLDAQKILEGAAAPFASFACVARVRSYLREDSLAKSARDAKVYRNIFGASAPFAGFAYLARVPLRFREEFLAQRTPRSPRVKPEVISWSLGSLCELRVLCESVSSGWILAYAPIVFPTQSGVPTSMWSQG